MGIPFWVPQMHTQERDRYKKNGLYTLQMYGAHPKCVGPTSLVSMVCIWGTQNGVPIALPVKLMLGT